MSSSMPAEKGGVVVVTPMYPTPPQGGSMGNPNNHHMTGLGAVQIMIGVVVFLYGVVELVLGSYSLALITGVFGWSSVHYIIAGSLTVAAGKSTNRCLMNTTVFFNITASLAALSGIGLYATDAAVINCDPGRWCDKYESLRQAMSSVLAVLHFLEFIITIVAGSMACKCCCGSGNQQQQQQQLPVYILPGKESMHREAPPTYSSAPGTMGQLPPQITVISNPATGQSFPGIINPPSYSSEPEEIKKS